MIRVECPSCGAQLRGPDHTAGRKIRCPGCGEPVLVPTPPQPPKASKPSKPSKPSGSFLDDLPQPDDAYGTDEPVLPRMVAPARVTADEVDDAPRPKKAKKKKKPARARSSGDDEELSGTDMVLCLLCPGIGCIAGLVYMITGRSKGLKVLGLSFLGNIGWGAVRLAFEYASK